MNYRDIKKPQLKIIRLRLICLKSLKYIINIVRKFQTLYSQSSLSDDVLGSYVIYLLTLCFIIIVLYIIFLFLCLYKCIINF